MQFYLRRNSYFSQVEAYSIFGVRAGFTAFGLASSLTRKRLPWYMRGPRLTIWSHSGQSDQYWVFRFHLFGCDIGYLTRGDARPEHDSYYSCGWRARLRRSLPTPA